MKKALITGITGQDGGVSKVFSYWATMNYRESGGDFKTHFNSVTRERIVFADLRFLDFTRHDINVSNPST